MTDDARVLQLLEEALDSERTPEEVCAAVPELLPAVRAAWERCRQVDARLDDLFPSGTPRADPGEPGGASGADGARRPLPGVASSAAAPPPLPSIPGYEVESVLGRGGVGVVYRASHLRLRRPVALKMLLSGAYAGPVERARFLREAQAVASLRHPHVVQVHDVGEHDGRPYFTMELMDGGSLAEALGGVPQPAKDAAVLLTAVADAMEAAHRAGIVHRDLKPSNVLLTADGTPKVSDFGLAHRSADDGDVELTLTGTRLGTPSYMAPEQVFGRRGTVGPPADVYALGAILYETLTGRPPFRSDSAAETERQLIVQDPVPPSRLNARVPRDLETICLKCLRKDAAQRYPSAAELSADLQRFSRGEPIHARPLSWAGHTARWFKRHPALAAALTGVAALLVLLTGVSLVATAYFRQTERQQRALAEENGRIAGEREAERRKAVRAEQQQAELRHRAEHEGQTLRNNLYFNQMTLAAQAAMSPSGVGRVTEWLKPWAAGQPDLRDWEWYYLAGLCHRELATLSGVNAVLHASWSPDGRQLASGGTDGFITVWDAATGREVRRWAGHVGREREVDTVAWSPDGRRLASAARDGTVTVWNAGAGDAALTFRGHAASVFAAAWSPSGSQLASVSADHTVQVWDAKTGAVRHVLRAPVTDISDVAWSPDGRRLATTHSDFQVFIWDAASGKELRRLSGHRNLVNRVAWSPDGHRLASASNDQTVKVWNAATGAEAATLKGHAMGVRSVAWHPDGTRLVTGSEDQTVKVWSAAGGVERATLRGHTQRVSSVAWGPDGARLASASFDGTIRVWDAATGPEVLALAGHTDPVFAVAWSPDGGRLVSASSDKRVKVWDARAGKELFTLPDTADRLASAAWSPDGTRLATGGADHTIRVYDAATGERRGSFRAVAESIPGLSWSPDGRRLASGGDDGVVRVWDPSNGNELQQCRGHRGAVSSVAWSPDGARLASGSDDRTARVWDVGTGKELHACAGHESEINGVAWSPDGRRFASASNDQTVRVWDAGTGHSTLVLRGHAAAVNGVAWGPGGTRLATGSDDRTIKLWDAATGRETLTVDRAAMVHAVAWRPDGLALASAGEDHRIRVHDATPGYLAARSPKYLPALDARLAAGPVDAGDWRLRAEINARRGDWRGAAADAERYLAVSSKRQWLTLGYWVAGPYPADFDAGHAPERAHDPARPAPGDDPSATVNWQPVPLDGNGFVNFGQLSDRAENVSAYALLRVYSPRRQEAVILVGSDDGVRLWLNGRRVHDARAERAAVPGSDAVRVTLEAGWNPLLARVVNVTGRHCLYLRIADDEPAPTPPTGGGS